VPVVPSPKSHEYDEIVPSLSVDALASNEQLRLVQLTVKLAVGGTFTSPLLGLTSIVNVAVAPRLSVTVSVTSRRTPSGKL
jgi:hypothetical protein